MNASSILTSKNDIHLILDKWIRQAQVMAKPEAAKGCWYLKDMIDDVCLGTSEPIARRFLAGLKYTEEVQKVRLYLDALGVHETKAGQSSV